MSVKRFDCTSDKNACGVMEQYSLGDWVSFDDYEKLEAELAAAKTLAGVFLAENQRLREALNKYGVHSPYCVSHIHKKCDCGLREDSELGEQR